MFRHMTVFDQSDYSIDQLNCRTVATYKVQLSLDRFHMESFPEGPKFGSLILPDTWEGFASLGSEVSLCIVIQYSPGNEVRFSR